MSFSSVEEELLKRNAKLLHYANNKRIDGDFNDVIIQAGAERISANRMVLACYSKFFESMFLSPLKEKFQNTVEIKQFNGMAVKQIIEFIYTGNIDINLNNVFTVLGTADFLQVDDVKKLCFDFMEISLTVDSCLDVMKASILYNNPFLQQTYQYISDDFDEIMQRDSFKQLSKDELIPLLANLNSSVQETSIFDALLHWIKHDQHREADFPALFLSLNLQKLPFEFVTGKVAKEPLVQTNNDCLNALVSYFSDKPTVFFGNSDSAETPHEKASKMLCVGEADNNKSVSEIFSVSGETLKNYPDLPHEISNHGVLKLHNFIYCIGGIDGCKATNCVYRLNLRDTNYFGWEEVASMAEKRCDFGAAVYKGCLVVAGGFNGKFRISTTELYEPRLNKLRTIAQLNTARDHHVLVAAYGSLFAIGGRDEEFRYLDSTEQLDNLHGTWKVVKSMNEARKLFAAVAIDDFIYAIGGVISNGITKTVEKYDCNKKQWSFVKSMNMKRCYCAACVLSGKIYVAGGTDESGNFVKAVECYDPALNQWTVVGEVDKGCGQTTVAV